MTVYVLIWEDRHTDTEARVFATQLKAEAQARQYARDNMKHYGIKADDEGEFHKHCKEELTPSMERNGWLYYITLGDEGPHGHVVAREIEK